MKKHWTEEEKREFLADFEGHQANGARKKAAYAMAKIDFQQAGKIPPAFSTFERWIYVDKAAPAEAESSSAEAAEDMEITAAEEPAEFAIEEPEESAETKMLKSLLRLYRTRSEEAIDALVDVLFPNLTEAER